MEVIASRQPIAQDQEVEHSGGLQCLQWQEYGVRDMTTATREWSLDSPNKTVRQFISAYDHPLMAQAAAEILGYATYNYDATSNPNRKLKRWLPEKDPQVPRNIATKVTAKPYAGEHGASSYHTIEGHRLANWQKIIWTVEYTAAQYEVHSDSEISGHNAEAGRYVSLELKPQADYFALPTGAMQWSEGSNSVDGGSPSSKAFPGQIGKIVGTVDYLWTWRRVPYEALPLAQIQATIGKVNKTDLAGTVTWPAHSQLLTGVDCVRHMGPRGQWEWDIKYTVKYQKDLHTRFIDFHSTGKAFYQVSIDGVKYTAGSVADGKLVFDEKEFLDLWRVDANRTSDIA